MRNGRDPALTAAHVDVRVSMAAAEQRRDTEVAKLHEERSEVVQPLRAVRNTNHLAELANRALLRRML
jgi:uncharacterized lipoprotein YajG